MSETAPRNRPQTPVAEPSAGTPKTFGRSIDPGARGRTTIADGVVEKIAGMAARDVVGVHAMGGGIARTLEPSATGCPAAANRPPAG